MTDQELKGRWARSRSDLLYEDYPPSAGLVALKAKLGELNLRAMGGAVVREMANHAATMPGTQLHTPSMSESQLTAEKLLIAKGEATARERKRILTRLEAIKPATEPFSRGSFEMIRKHELALWQKLVDAVMNEDPPDTESRRAAIAAVVGKL